MQIFETLAHLFQPRRSNNHRARLLHPENIFSIVLILIGFGLALQNIKFFSKDLGSILGYASDITVSQVVTLTNAERAQGGLGTVTLNESLSSAARAKAADMFANQYWAHVSPSGRQPWDFIKESSYSFSAAGENLARDFSTTPEMVDAWMGSPSHKANIMNPNYTEIGIAVVNGNLQGIDTTLVVQMFGRPASAQSASITQEASNTVVKEILGQAIKANPNLATTNPNATPIPSISPQEEMKLYVKDPLHTPLPTSDVLADMSLPVGALQQGRISPLDVMKPVFIGILLLIILTLAYDAHMFERKNTFRVVGKNLAHILFLATVASIIIIFKAGVIK